MISPLADGEWLTLQQCASTQDEATALLKAGQEVGVVFTSDQTGGRGRFGRPWHCEPGECIAMSMVFRGYTDHPRPYLIGMAVAVAAAGVIHCELRWPNDLILGARKVGGILTELIEDPEGRSVPVVGVGINLNQKAFPEEIAGIATSKALYDGGLYNPEVVARNIIERLALLPEPRNWSDVAPVWSLFDNTPGKTYKLPGGQEATALGIGPQGELLCSVHGESTTVLAADAIFGV